MWKVMSEVDPYIESEIELGGPFDHSEGYKTNYWTQYTIVLRFVRLCTLRNGNNCIRPVVNEPYRYTKIN
jgi:hypothetical protein